MSTSLTEKYNRALLFQDVIRPLAAKIRLTKGEVIDACARLNLKRSAIYSWIQKYRAAPYLTTFLAEAEGGKPHYRGRLTPEVEEILRQCIQEYYLERDEKTGPKDVYAAVFVRCVDAGHEPPSLRTIHRRMAPILKRDKVRSGKMNLSRRSMEPHPGHHFKLLPLEQVQLDHTLIDLMADLREYGLGIRRIWLTIAIDVATRLIFGYYLGIARPTARTFMFPLLQGALPKTTWIESQGISSDHLTSIGCDDPWPLSGLPAQVHMDNGSDLKSRLVRRACRSLGIDVDYRPPGAPHYGAHIERLIGTMMGRIKVLPGTTYSNVVEKREYQSEKRTLFRLEEFEAWFMLEVLRYHHSVNRNIGMTPLQKFAELKPLISKSSLKSPDPFRVQYVFLPSVSRKVGPHGIKLNHRTYWHDSLKDMGGIDVRIVYRPWDMRAVSLSLDGQSEHLRLELQADGSHILHGDIWDMVQNDPAKKVEAKRQEGIAHQLRMAQFDLVDSIAKQRKSRVPSILMPEDASNEHTDIPNLLPVSDVVECNAASEEW